MNRQETITKIEAILRGEISAKEAFAPHTTKMWEEVELGLFECREDGVRCRIDEIKPVPNCWQLAWHRFDCFGRKTPPLASSEEEAEANLERWTY